MTPSIPSARDLSAYHDACLEQARALDAPDAGALWTAVATNHACNTGLWDEEDQARRTDVAAEAIAANKRAIDGFNQRRNDATETIDEVLLASLSEVVRSPSCRLNSETAGSMVDRLSILSLKIHHMRLQTLRSEVDEAHRARCRERAAILAVQRGDLQACFDALISDARAGRAYFKVYRQFKMYNDPKLNPYLYPASGSEPR
jgi:hypothetical protein